jgi:ribonuclease BN (tRNA processing enzyme)
VSIQLVTLGTKGGPALRPNGPRPSSSLLDWHGQQVLIDAGLGVTQAWVDTGRDLRDLRTIVVTHLHSDHVLELGPLLHTAWTTGLAQPVTVWGPAGLQTLWQGFLASLRYDIDLRVVDEGRLPLEDLVHFHTLTAGTPIPLADGLTLTALEVVHPPVTPAFALRLGDPAHTVVFSGDTAFYPPLAKFAYGCDLLVHEAMLTSGIDRLVNKTGGGEALRQHLLASHTTAQQAGEIARRANAKHLVLHHLIPADDPTVTSDDWVNAVRETYAGALTVARDGLSIVV